ncbi:MAG: MBL fold metallo-hydrolase [Candidatus Eisenbacteria bacterium]
MKVTFCGVRGTAPASGPEFNEFGGHTTAVLVHGRDGEAVCIDAGTGAIDAGRILDSGGGPSSLLLLVTHCHLDHIMGLGVFSPLHGPDWRVRFAAPRRDGPSVRDGITKILDEPYWPVRLAGMAATIEWVDLSDGAPAPYLHGGLQVRWCAVRHNGVCTAYRLDEPATGASLVFATDMEWGRSTDTEKAAFLRFCAEPSPARLLVIDGQYTRETYTEHRGWGHGTVEEAAEIAGEARVGRLLVTHHAPDRTDALLRLVEARLAELAPNAGLARQGMIVEV